MKDKKVHYHYRIEIKKAVCGMWLYFCDNNVATIDANDVTCKRCQKWLDKEKKEIDIIMGRK